MEVILRQHVENLGRRGEIVKVADGYARNYLLPRKLALLATDGNKKQVERERAKLDVVEAEEQKVAAAIGDRLGAIEVSKSNERSARPRPCTVRSRPRTSEKRCRRRASTSIGGKFNCRSRSRSSASTRCRSSCIARSRCASRCTSSRKAETRRKRKSEVRVRSQVLLRAFGRWSASDFLYVFGCSFCNAVLTCGFTFSLRHFLLTCRSS